MSLVKSTEYGDFTPHSSETSQPTFDKLEMYNRTVPRVQTFRDYVDVGGLSK